MLGGGKKIIYIGAHGWSSRLESEWIALGSRVNVTRRARVCVRATNREQRGSHTRTDGRHREERHLELQSVSLPAQRWLHRFWRQTPNAQVSHFAVARSLLAKSFASATTSRREENVFARIASYPRHPFALEREGVHAYETLAR